MLVEDALDQILPHVKLDYAGGWEDIRAQTLTGAERGGDLKTMEALVDQCMADYDQNGWLGDTWS